MSRILLGIGALAATPTRGETIYTLALGSCVAVVLRCRFSGAVGMVHIALPTGSSPARPGYYADTGIPLLMEAMTRVGGAPKTMDVTLVGGASVISPLESFNIGKRNLLAARKCLWRFGLGVLTEEVEGEISRTVSATVGEKGVQVSNPTRGTWTI